MQTVYESNNYRVVGLDCGNRGIKVSLMDGPNLKIAYIPAVVIEGYDRSLTIGARQQLGAKDPHPLDDIDVTIASISNGRESFKGRFFAGSLAIDEGGKFVADRLKFTHPSVMAAVLSTIGTMIDSPVENLLIYTGMTVNDYKDKEIRERYTDGLVGNFALEYHSSKLAGQRRTYHLLPTEAGFQGFGGFANLALDVWGNAANREIVNKTVAIVDIGFETTDVVYVQNGTVKTTYSAGFPIGTRHVYDSLMEFLNNHGGNFTREVIDNKFAEYHSKGEVTVRIKDKSYPMSRNIQNAYKKEIVDKLVQELLKKWPNPGEIDEIYLMGGGSVGSFDEFVKAFPQTKKPSFPEDVLAKYPAIADPFFCNAIGYMKIGMRKHYNVSAVNA